MIGKASPCDLELTYICRTMDVIDAEGLKSNHYEIGRVSV